MKIIKAQKLTRFNHLNMFKIAYEDRNGKRKTWLIASRDREPKCVTGRFSVPDGVIIVPFHLEQKKLVVIREFRVAVGDYKYGFPAGLVDEGETAAEAAKRELREETGLTLKRIIRISPPIFSSTGMTDETTSIVYVECDGKFSNRENSTTEDIQPVFTSPEDAAALCSNPNLKFDAKAWLILHMFSVTGRILN
jgi:ADP-ribose pyrophosphatase